MSHFKLLRWPIYKIHILMKYVTIYNAWITLGFLGHNTRNFYFIKDRFSRYTEFKFYQFLTESEETQKMFTGHYEPTLTKYWLWGFQFFFVCIYVLCGARSIRRRRKMLFLKLNRSPSTICLESNWLLSSVQAEYTF